MAERAVVAVVGAGWNGCFVAEALKLRGHVVKLYDSQDRVLSEQFGSPWWPLPSPFMYPTRADDRWHAAVLPGELRRSHPELVRTLRGSVVAVTEDAAELDAVTYRTIMSSEMESEFVEVPRTEFGMRGVAWAALVRRDVVSVQRARQYFGTGLGDDLVLGCSVDEVESVGEFDCLVDCTFGGVLPRRGLSYSLIAVPLYIGDSSYSMMFVDGADRIDLVPSGDSTLVGVETTRNSVVFRGSSLSETRDRLERLRESEVQREGVLSRIEAEITRFLPDFRSDYTFVGFTAAIRRHGESHWSSMPVSRRGRVLFVEPQLWSAPDRVAREVVGTVDALDGGRIALLCETRQ